MGWFPPPAISLLAPYLLLALPAWSDPLRAGHHPSHFSDLCRWVIR